MQCNTKGVHIARPQRGYVNLKFFKFFRFFLFTVFVFSKTSYANNIAPFQHPFYIGASGGYGSTTWGGLVPSKENENSAVSMSTPIAANEGGTVWGAFAGYEFSPYFALEFNYQHFPDATVSFDETSFFSFTHDGLESFTTKTETANIMAKIMLIIPNTNVRLYSSAGVARVYRDDLINDDWHVGPTFGVGVNYHVFEHLMAEINANYTAGFGESQLDPAETYYPFLYSVTARLAYCF
jgi:hypothetical protein